LKTFYPIATAFANNLIRLWDMKGDYWEAMKVISASAGEE